jgi:hypothetical protein
VSVKIAEHRFLLLAVVVFLGPAFGSGRISSRKEFVGPAISSNPVDVD